MKIQYRAFVAVVIIVLILQNYRLSHKPPKVITETKVVEKVVEKVIEKEVPIKGYIKDFTEEEMVNEIAKETGIKASLIEAQLRHESGNFKSRRAVQNNNFAGIGVYNERKEGAIYNSKIQFAYKYSKALKSKYPEAIGSQTMEQFASALQDYKNRWAMDPEYKSKLVRVHNNLT